jgi:hypothetical protein
MPTPTAEQQAIIDAYRAGQNLVIEAGAGTGKTTTLKMLGAAAPNRSGLYIAYNKAIAADAGRSFPRHVECRTAHSLAFRAVGKDYKRRLDGPRQPARVVAQLLRVDPLRVDASLMLGPMQVARVVNDTVASFCRSADAEIGRQHVPFIEGITGPEAKARLREAVVPLARKAWADLARPDGRLKFQHDHYLKIWQLTGPKLEVDVVMLDEAQDANPLIADIVERQEHAQRVMVGDASQAIYAWNGAVDALSKFKADARLQLSESFRFGPPIAAEANKWLGIIGATLRLTGRAAHASHLAELPDADAILCRTNAGAVGQLMAAAAEGRRAALVGGGDQIKRLAEAALELQRGMPTSHPELMAFQTWGQLRQYVEEEAAGSDLKVFVRLVDQHGAAAVIATMEGLTDERYAQVVVSTSHKAKGREWDRVRVASDFQEPKAGKDGEPGATRPDEAMLAYVTVTRARRVLDRGGLAWVDKWLQGPAPAPAGQLALAELEDEEDDGLEDESSEEEIEREERLEEAKHLATDDADYLRRVEVVESEYEQQLQRVAQHMATYQRPEAEPVPESGSSSIRPGGAEPASEPVVQPAQESLQEPGQSASAPATTDPELVGIVERLGKATAAAQQTLAELADEPEPNGRPAPRNWLEEALEREYQISIDLGLIDAKK